MSSIWSEILLSAQAFFAAVVTEDVPDFCIVDIVCAVHSGYILK